MMNLKKKYKEYEKEISDVCNSLSSDSNSLKTEFPSYEESIKFTHADPFWITALYERGKKINTPRIYTPIVENKSLFTLPDSFHIGLVGDIGTGDAHCLATLKGIKSTGKLDAFIHLGDVYYSGTRREMLDNFLSPIKWILSDDVPIYAIPGNHEYICKGEGYSQVKEYFQNREYSVFCLENKNLQIIGLDTGYKSHNFEFPWMSPKSRSTPISDDQLRWLRSVYNKEKKTILLTHHAFTSAYWNSYNGSLVNEILKEQIKSVLPLDKITWFWGDEHKLLIYEEKYEGLFRGRCIGCGAMPESCKPLVHANLIKNPIMDNKNLFNRGFVTLTGDDKKINVYYYEIVDEKPLMLFTEVIYY